MVTLLDAGQIMADPVAVRLLKDLATTRGGPTLVVTGLGPAVPEELEGVAISWVLPAPDRAEMAAVVRRLSVTLPRMGLRMEVADPNRLVDAVLGLTPAEAERVLLQQAVVDGRLDDSDAVAAQRARAELLSEGPLDLIDPDRVPSGYQESLRAAQVRHRPPPQHRSDAERDAALARLGGLIADKRAQILLERKQRRPY